MGRPPGCLRAPREGSPPLGMLMLVTQIPAPTAQQDRGLLFALPQDAEQRELSPDSWRL